jgi:hypothetical protein
MSNTNEPGGARTFLALRTCASDMTGYGGFRWPERGPVEAADWDPRPVCGGGLHGLKWGEGSGLLLSWHDKAKWLVVEVVEGTEVDLDGKVKFPAGNVVFCGDRRGATDYILAHGGAGRAVVGATVTGGHGARVVGGDFAEVTGGDCATVIGGDSAVVTGGDCATVIGGESAVVTGGDSATVIGGCGATVTGGDRAMVTGGDRAMVTGGHGAIVTGGGRAIVTGGGHAMVTGGDYATVTGGDYATVTGGDCATVTGGDYATVTGGDCATVTGGDYATVTGGSNATVAGGEGATLVCRWFARGRGGIATGRIGRRGLEPGVPYKCVRGRFVPVGKATD